MNNLDLIDKSIEEKIYTIRGKHVMLARDVAKLYNVETFRINEVVKRNIKRFPEDFCFQLTKDECEKIFSISQIAMLNKNGDYRGTNIKYLPYVFSEHGIMMLSGLLKSDIAALVNIKIINAFVAMRKLLNNNFEIRLGNLEQIAISVDNKLIENDKKFEELFSKFKNPVNTSLFFNGEIYNAHSLLIDIFNTAKDNIIIIDNYVDKYLLDILAKTHKKVIIFTRNVDENDLRKYLKQYHNIIINITKDFHDRFIILDKKALYHCGASFKDLGKKCFAINKIDSLEILSNLLQKLKII